MLGYLSSKFFWKRQLFGIMVFVLVMAGSTFFSPLMAYAEELGLPENVVVVKNEKQMISKLVKGMKRHQEEFAFYYPGIEKDFKQYQKQSAAYATFWERICQKDGYITGVVSGYCITTGGTDVTYVTLQFGYLTSKYQERVINRKVKKIAKRYSKGSKASRIKKVHNYLISHMRYDQRYYNPYYAFTKGRGMCMSYALAFQRIMQEMNIPCVYVKGSNHAWNMVKIGRYWYNVDVTWDDAGGKPYRYFLKSDAAFPGHKRPKTKWIRSLKKAPKSYPVKE